MSAVLCEELIGRGDLLDVVRAAFDSAVDRHGRLLFVTGEAGVGKSRLTREVVDLARARGLNVLLGRAVAAEVPAPFRPIAGALLTHFRGQALPDDPELAAFRPALGQLLPQWRSSGSGDPEPIVVLAEAVIRLLSVGGRESGCLLVLEDLHWADVETLALLEYFADALRSEPIICLATVRSEEPSAARQLAHKLSAARSATLLELSPLSPDELEQMASACMRAPVAEDALEFLRTWSDGVPFMIEELLAGAMSAGAMVKVGDRWLLDTSVSPTLPVTFADNVRGRVRRLGVDGERLLQFAAVLGRRFDWSLLPGVTGLTDEVVLGLLRAGVAGQLLVAEPGSQFRFRHSLTRDAVLDDLLPAELASLAAQLLAAVLAAQPGLRGEWCEAAAVLAETAGQQEQAAALLLELGRRSLASGALGSAEQLLARARRATESDELHADIDEVALVVLALAGKTEDAISVGSRLTDRLLRQDASPDRRAQAHLGVARAAVTAGHWDVAASHLESAKASVETTDSELAARIQIGAAEVAIGLGDPTSAVAQAEQALDLAERFGVHQLACEALEIIGRCSRLSAPNVAETTFHRALAIAEEHDLVLWQARAMAELGTLDMVNCRDFDRLHRARELALECGAFAIAAHVEVTTGALAINRFDLDAARYHLDRAAKLAQTLGMSRLQAIALADRAITCALSADTDGVESDFADVVAGAGNDPVALGLAWSARGMLALLTEQRDSAHAHLQRSAEHFATMPTAPAIGTRGLQVLLLAQDDHGSERARAALVAADAAGLRASHAISRGYLGLAEAVTHGRAGHSAKADASFVAADGALARADGWRHCAYRLVAPDAIAHGWGDPARWLREALAFFEARNLPRVADACRALLRDAGVPVPRRTKAADGVPERFRAAGVTAREAEILALLADGLTNQQIAERTFLSTRTVERHLANIAAKIGTGTRSELVALAARATAV